MHASVKMSQQHKGTTFVTTSDLQDNPSLIDGMRRNGYNPVVVPDSIISKIKQDRFLYKYKLYRVEIVSRYK